MSLTLALNNALSGLGVNQRSLAVLSQNIANVNTRGYSRKIVQQESQYLDGNGVGVSVSDVTRKIDLYLAGAKLKQNATANKASTISEFFSRSQLLIGRPGTNTNISSYINNFFNALQSLGQTPENPTLRVGAVNAGATLAKQSRQLAEGIHELQYQADQDIATSVDNINRNLRQIRELNIAINGSIATGKSTAELEDKRDLLLRDLTQYLEIETFTRSTGEVNISVTGGISLLDESLYELDYSPASSTDAFASGVSLSPVQIYRLDANGNRAGQPKEIVSGGPSSQVTTIITSGKLRGLLDMRDTEFPRLLRQLDLLTSNLRESINASHNRGISFPGANSYTGTRSLLSTDYSLWTGKTRIAVLDANGKPILSPYGEAGGVRPLDLDLSSLDTGNGPGYPSLQGIIDEINYYYGPPQNKVTLGNLSNIRLASDTGTMPGSPPRFSFDFDLENISATNSNFFVTGVQVLDSTATDITSLVSNVPQVAIDPAASYTMTDGSDSVTINTTAPHGLVEGDRIYLSTPPGGPYNGIDAANLGGFFIISNVTSTGFQIQVADPATADGTSAVAGQTITPKYATVGPGEYNRTTSDGIVTADLSLNSTSPFYTVKVNVAVDDGNGGFTTSQLTYRVDNNLSNQRNRRYAVQNATGDGTLVTPSDNRALARAMMVDENGVELLRVNGQYSTQQRGFLKIVAENTSYVIAIDSLDSSEQGQPNNSPPVAASNRGFSHYFELNNFFKSVGGDTGDTVSGSAAMLALEQRLLDNPNLISLGLLSRSASTDPNNPIYTYERNVGDNSIIQEMTTLSSTLIAFASLTGSGTTRQTFGDYAAGIIGSTSSNAAAADSDLENAQTLLDGFDARADAISGVNLDEELANTIIYQNAYTATARIITTTGELFETLLNAF